MVQTQKRVLFLLKRTCAEKYMRLSQGQRQFLRQMLTWFAADDDRVGDKLTYLSASQTYVLQLSHKLSVLFTDQGDDAPIMVKDVVILRK